MIFWDLYEIRSKAGVLHGVKLRGRIRKFTIESGIACFVENAQDEENVVRFCLLAEADLKPVLEFIKDIIPEVVVVDSLKNIPNPVLSKLKVNELSRYKTP